MGPNRLVSLQLFENNRFIVMSKMQKGVHGWFLPETCETTGLCQKTISIVRGLIQKHYVIQYAALVVF
jgi:hypothetical protein